MGRTSSSTMDMDQFMNDFLEGKYLDDAAPAASDDTALCMPRRKSHEEGHARGASPIRGVRRAKSNDGILSRPDGKRRPMRRTKSGEEGRGLARTKSSEEGREISKRKSSKSKEQMDPHMVLRMLEMYASEDNAEKADEYLHYNSTKRTSKTSADSISLSRAILVPPETPEAA
jgi:hypothetical protein